MGKCNSVIREVRFKIEDELTQAYVFCEAVGDCPIGVQGWHHKTFPKSVSIIEIMDKDISNCLYWSLEAP